MPMMAGLALGSFSSGQVYRKLGPKRCVSAGFVMTILGAITVLLMRPDWGYGGLVVPMLLLSLGVGYVTGPAGTSTVEAVPHKDASLAGGLSFMVHLVVGAIGLAMATAILNASSLSRLGAGLEAAKISMTSQQVATLNGSVPGGGKVQGVLTHLDPAQTETVHTLLREAFARGMGDAFWVCLVAAVLGLLCVLSINESTIRDALADEPTDTPTETAADEAN
jgi:DHA2 family methylenomycin A resistance protein-like MFS transporter